MFKTKLRLKLLLLFLLAREQLKKLTRVFGKDFRMRMTNENIHIMFACGIFPQLQQVKREKHPFYLTLHMKCNFTSPPPSLTPLFLSLSCIFVY